MPFRPAERNRVDTFGALLRQWRRSEYLLEKVSVIMSVDPRFQRTRKRVISAAASVLAVSLALGACSSGEGSDGDTTNLRVAIPSDVVSLDPQLQGDMTSMGVASNIFDTLTVRQADGELGPGLATKWEQTDPKTWMFTIRDGVEFQNGEKLDADTVAFSINRLLDPETKSPIVELANVKEAVAEDSSTVKFVMKQSDPVLPAKLSLFGGVVVPQKLIEKEGDEEFAKHPVGTGPYEFVSRSQADEIVLKANSDYWGEAPSVENLTFKIMPDPSASIQTLQAGEVDIVSALSTDAAAQLEGNPDTSVHSVPGIRTYSVNLDTISDGPLADRSVRQALNYAVDVPSLVDTIQGGAAQQAATLLPSNSFGYDASIKSYEHNVEKAKNLLKEAGYEDGFDTTLTASETDSSLAQAVSGQLAEVGVNAEVRVLDAQSAKSELITLNEKHDKGMFLMANSGWTMDAVSYIQSMVKSDRRSSRWDNKEANKLVIQGETKTDDDDRIAAYKQLQTLLHDEAPFVYMFTIDNTYATSQGVEWDMPTTGVLSMAEAVKK